MFKISALCILLQSCRKLKELRCWCSVVLSGGRNQDTGENHRKQQLAKMQLYILNMYRGGPSIVSFQCRVQIDKPLRKIPLLIYSPNSPFKWNFGTKERFSGKLSLNLPFCYWFTCSVIFSLWFSSQDEHLLDGKMHLHSFKPGTVLTHQGEQVQL